MCNIMKRLLLFILLLVPYLCLAQSNQELAVDFMAMKDAAEKGNIALVKSLLNKGINPNGYTFKETPTKETYFSQQTDRPIHVASEEGHLEIVKLLLEHKADPSWCCCSCVTALHLAIQANHVDITRLLLANGADPNIVHDLEVDSFGLAQKYGNNEMIELLKKYKSSTKTAK